MKEARRKPGLARLLADVDRMVSAELGVPCHTEFGRAEEAVTSGGTCRVAKRHSGRLSYFLDDLPLQSLDHLSRPVLEGLRDALLRLRDHDLLWVSLNGQRFRIRLYPLDRAHRGRHGALAGRQVSLPPAEEPGGSPTSRQQEARLAIYLETLARHGGPLGRLLDGLNRHMPWPLERLELVTETVFTDAVGMAYRDVKLLPTLGCLQRCLFCCAREPRRPFPVARLRAALVEIRESGDLSRTRLSFSGGEPTLHPALAELMRYGRQLGFPWIGLQTSGVLLGRTPLLEDLCQAGLDQVIFSLHSHHPETYDRITSTRGQLPRAMEGLRRVLKQPIPSVLLNFVICRQNVHQLADYADFVASLPHHPRTELSVMPSIVFMEWDNGRWGEVALPHSEAAAALREAVIRHGRLFTNLQGDCFFPFCIAARFPELADLAPSIRADSPTVYLEQRRPRPEQVPRQRRVKHRECRSCAMDSRCGGLAGEYARHFGLDELTPLEPSEGRAR